MAPQNDTGYSETFFSRGPLPFARSKGAYANLWSPLSSQGTWRDSLWRPLAQQTDFAERSIILSGATFSSVGNVASGVGKTRSADTWSFDGEESKYFIGSTSIGTSLRGFSSFDDTRIVGSANYAFTNFYDPEDEEEDGNNEKRVHIFGMAGVEGFAHASRRISADLSTGSGKVDARTSTIHPRDALDVTPSVIQFLIGMSGGAIIDNKRAGYCVPEYLGNPPGGGAPPMTHAGYINTAMGVRATVGAATRTSWINLNSAIGVASSFYLVDNPELLPPSPGHFCDLPCCGERSGSRVGSWIAVFAGTPPGSPSGCPPVAFGASAAAFLYDQTPDGDGGSPIMASQLVARDDAYEAESIQVERFSGIISRGTTVLGDSEATLDTHGYDTDVVHIRDVLHLTPREGPPEFDPTLPPSERVGLVYFDINRNAPVISVAMPDETGQVSWQDSSIGWVEFALKPADVRVTNGITTSNIDEQEFEHRNNLARNSAGDGTSQYLHPRVELLSTLLSENSFVVTALTTGFQGLTPRMYWKLEGQGPDRIGETGWVEVEVDQIFSPFSDETESDGFSFLIEYGGSSNEGASNSLHGRTVKLLAIHPTTGQTTGSSCKLK